MNWERSGVTRPPSWPRRCAGSGLGRRGSGGLGNTASLLAEALRLLGMPNLVVSIDAFDLVDPEGGPQGVLQDWVRKNAAWGGSAVCIRAFTEEAARFFRPGCASFLLIDACHDYDSVYRDIQRYLPVVKPGGIIFMDDHEPQHYPGVCRAAEELLFRGGAALALKVTANYAVFQKR